MRTLTDYRVSAVPVAADGRPVGIVSDAELAVDLTNAVDGVVDVVNELGYRRDDSHPTAYPRA